MFPIIDEIMNPWDGPRDGWGRFDPYSPIIKILGVPCHRTVFERFRSIRMK